MATLIVKMSGRPQIFKEKGAAASAIKAKTPQPRQFGRAAERSGEIGFAPPPRSSRSLKAFWSNNETKKPIPLSFSLGTHFFSSERVQKNLLSEVWKLDCR